MRVVTLPPMLTAKAKVFWPLLFLLIFADCTTKRLAE